MDFNNTISKFLTSIIEYWNHFLFVLPRIIVSLFILTIGYIFISLFSRIIKKILLKRTNDPLMSNFLTKSIKLVILITIAMLALKMSGFGDIAAGVLATAGASAVILGFAFKDIGENFISGVILSFNRPFDIDDTVRVDEIFGKVKAMEFRYTKLKTFDGRDVYIPNADIIKKAVYNYTEDGYFRLDFMVGIDYEDNIDLAKSVIKTAVINTTGVIDDATHECFVSVDSLGVSTVNLKVIFWTLTKEYRKGAVEIKSNVVKNVKNVIMNNGLNMPADITEIKLYGSQDSIPVTVKNITDDS